MAMVDHEASASGSGRRAGYFSVDVEDWFNILDIAAAPPLASWDDCEIRFEVPMRRLLDLLDVHQSRATFFWLGWFAERYPELVRECLRRGHEIASHGYSHRLATDFVTPQDFRHDLDTSKKILEDITGQGVTGFRSPGFCTLHDSPWFFEEIRAAGYLYDSSIFPAARGHGGAVGSPMQPYAIPTAAGTLVELPQSLVELGSCRFSVFGGGYFRLAPLSLIRWGIRHLERQGRPLIVYLHPREIDPEQPRLAMPFKRRFKSYVNLAGTYRKLEALCREHKFERMDVLAQQVAGWNA